MPAFPARLGGCILLFLLLECGFCFPVSARADSPEPARVLVLHSYHQGFSWTDALQRGLEETFEAAPMEIELSVEHLDTKRHPGRLLFENLAQVYADKYERWRPDLILSCDDDALAFLFQYRNALFPGVPVVFCGLNVEDYDPRILKNRVGYTGVVERLDLAGTIDLILDMQPDVVRIAFVHDRTTSGLADRRTIAALAPRYADRVAFVYPDNGKIPGLGVSEAELLSFLQDLPLNSAVYFLGFFRDRFDTPLALDTIIPRISEASPVPVYSHADAYLGYGILGGKLLSAEVHGRSTAEKALRLLAGASAAQMPVTVESSNRYMFDYRQLKRFGISPSRLPADSLILFEPTSFWERHRTALAWGIGGLVALLSFTAALLVNTVRRHRIERRLAASEKQYRLLADHATDMITRHDPEGNYFYASPACRGLLGYEPEELIGRNAYELNHPEDLDRIRNSHRTILNQRIIFTVAYRILHKQGHFAWVETTSKTIRDPQTDEIEEIIAVTRDIAERKQAESELLKSNALLLTAEQLAGLGSWEWDILADHWTFSDNWCVLHGVDEPPTASGDLMALAHPEDVPQIQAAFDQALESGAYEIAHRTIKSDTGEVRHIHAYGTLLRDEAGRPSKLHGTAQDVTELRQAQEERLRMERHLQTVQRLESLGVLAGGIAHDFNNILMTMLGNMELVKETVSSDSTARLQLEDALTAGQRAAALIRQMLAFSGKGRFVVRPLNLNRLIESMFELLQAAVPGRISLTLNLERPLPKVDADESQIGQILMNLILNAAESYEKNAEGPVTLSTGAADCEAPDLSETEPDVWLPYEAPFAESRFVFLEVKDTGSGLDSETRKHLFEPFYSTKFQGRGLGMAAVMGIVRGHKGFIRIDSEPGRGTAVRVLFPALAELHIADEPRPQPSSPASTPTGKEVVLLVDDEESIRTMIRQMLERIGYTVISAPGGPEAVEIFRGKSVEIDLVLCDLKMDDMSGLEVLHQLRRLDPDVRVILSSGYSEAELRSRYGGEGFAGFLQKPYRMQALKALLEQTLGRCERTDILS